MSNNVDAQNTKDKTVSGVVRFFNAGRGYGMVSILNPEAWDAFLHCSVLQRDKQRVPASGDIVECEVEMKSRGAEVVSVKSVKSQGEAKLSHRCAPQSPVDHAAGPTVEGEVKFFNFEKSFGFITTDHGDVFLHISVLSKAGIPGAFPGDRLVCDTVVTDKGLQAITAKKTQ